MASSKKDVLAVPTADREPLAEEHCLILEKLLELVINSVINPQGFDEVYRDLYPRDTDFDGVLMYSDINQLLQLIAKSRMFRREVSKYERRVSFGHEREVWEMYRKAHRRPMTEDESLQAEVDSITSIQQYKEGFEKAIGLKGTE